MKGFDMSKEPFFALAPMANITTYPFASQCAHFEADIVWTPMVHTDVVINNWPEAEKILDFKDVSNYIVQIIGSEVDNVKKAVRIIDQKLKPIGIDLNFACPDKNIVKSGCGGALTQDHDKIIELVRAAKSATKLPISVKTRAGWDNYNDVQTLTERLTAEKISVLTVHPRTVKQAFGGEADWSVIKKLTENFPELTICGSGDVKGWEDALEKQRYSGCQGVMIGRRALGHPWIFKEIKEQKSLKPSQTEITKLALELAQMADAIWGDKGITESKKHFGWYFRGFDGASNLRQRLMDCKNLKEVEEILKKKSN